LGLKDTKEILKIQELNIKQNQKGERIMDSEKTLEVEWPKLGIKVEAKGLSYNRELFDAFCKSLPFETIQLHAMVTGEDMYSYCPVSVVEYQNLIENKIKINEGPVGSVCWSGLGLVAIIYGPCTEPLTTQPIALIPQKYHDDLREAGRAAWESIFNTKQLLVVEFREKGGQIE
jgi:hypothetical protein